MQLRANESTPYVIRRAEPDDQPTILALYDRARAFMRASGNLSQWPDTYPGPDDVRSDTTTGNLYVCERDTEIVAVFFYAPGPDPTYQSIDGAWMSDTPYHVVHRIAALEGSGAGTFCLMWACRQAGHVRIDTHEDNAPMRHILSKLGFTERGTIICNDGTPRVAYECVRV